MDQHQKKIREFSRQCLGTSGSHGMDHTERVVNLCRTIGDAECADMDILIPAAYLHDIARPLETDRGLPHEHEGARMAGEFLISIGYDPVKIPQIMAAIRTHRYSSDEKPVSAEAQILSDADKLDAMGATGIARTFIRAGEHGGGIDDAVTHFHEKLLKLRNNMYTPSAQQIAQKRHAFLAGFLGALEEERSRGLS